MINAARNTAERFQLLLGAALLNVEVEPLNR